MTYTDRKLTAKSSIRNWLNQSLVEVTEDQNTTLEFVRYERMVQSHLVKIVGWCHNHWGNPSNLKGGVELLQTLALAVDNRTCRFVKISKDEAIKCLERIDAGEDLSPNKVDTEPYINDDDDRDIDIDVDVDVDINININIDNTNSNDRDGDNGNGSVGNSVPTGKPRSEITDDLIDPALQACGASAPAPSVPAFNSTPVTNHKCGAPEPSTDGAPAKRKRKMTEKAVYAARKAQKRNRRGKGPKSAAVVDSSDSDENEWEDL